MNKELYQIAVENCESVYKKNTDLGTTEFNTSYASFGNSYIQILSIAGTNEPMDWVKNLNIWSKRGIKKSAYNSAHEINQHFEREIKYKLLVTGHSKAGATAIAYKKLFGAEYCIAFAPARSLRYWSNRKMNNTTIFIDPDDPVSKVGFISFGHPACKIITGDDHVGLDLSDHSIGHWIEFVEQLE